MTGWDDGYVTDIVYTRQCYREMSPLGWQPPPYCWASGRLDLARPFRYADLGCGHGLTATIVAATCPHAERSLDSAPKNLQFPVGPDKSGR
jgi:hypothetical protein